MMYVPLRQVRSRSVLALCDKVTARLECINRELDELPLPADGIHPDIREVVSDALQNHNETCES